MKKAVIYARYSSYSQTEQSIEGQLRVCHNYAKENNFVILNEYIDRAKSAQTDQRPSFQKMLRDSAKKEFNYVIVYAVNRFSRDDGDYGADKKLLRLNGVKLISATEITSVNADGSENLGGILTEGVLVALSKYYSRELSQKVRRGQYETIQKKGHLGGNPLFGYTIKDKAILINEEQAHSIKTIFEMYSNGKSAFVIADYLNEKGIKNQFGRDFKPNAIMKILKNKKYIGTLVFGEYVVEDYYPPIIEKVLFDVVQEKIEKNKRSPARAKAKENYLLSGKIYCGYCHSQMDGESGTSRTGEIYYYYKCFGKKNKNGCKKKTIPKKQLEDIIIDSTITHLLRDDIIKDITVQLLKVQQENRDTSELTLLRKELVQVEGYIRNLLTAIKAGVITESTTAELQKMESERKILNEKILQAEYAVGAPLTKEQIEFWFKQFRSFSRDEEAARQYIVNYLINKIIAYDDKIIIIYNHDGDNRDELSIEDIEEAFGSDLEALPPPKAHNPNLYITKKFVALVIGL